ncbi:hypothetical protein T03_4024 [Trichinella britovi]|uniref:Uncharacterized protein n=1 Tax=Trichinella britovi TaxID=45882 RepID=A0A0V1D5G3_TRIBR|nr:hypothetical protein T03_4024 [Trichinella britovi]
MKSIRTIYDEAAAASTESSTSGNFLPFRLIYDEEVTAASAEPSSSLPISTGATSYPRLPINHYKEELLPALKRS